MAVTATPATSATPQISAASAKSRRAIRCGSAPSATRTAVSCCRRSARRSISTADIHHHDEQHEGGGDRDADQNRAHVANVVRVN